jgi:hypothetical protein
MLHVDTAPVVRLVFLAVCRSVPGSMTPSRSTLSEWSGRESSRAWFDRRHHSAEYTMRNTNRTIRECRIGASVSGWAAYLRFFDAPLFVC